MGVFKGIFWLENEAEIKGELANDRRCGVFPNFTQLRSLKCDTFFIIPSREGKIRINLSGRSDFDMVEVVIKGRHGTIEVSAGGEAGDNNSLDLQVKRGEVLKGKIDCIGGFDLEDETTCGEVVRYRAVIKYTE